MQNIVKQGIVQKMQELKANKLFENLSTSKLQKLSYYLKTLILKKGQVLYKEEDVASGVYIVVNGAVKYQKMSEFNVPIESKTNNKWMKT
jgi:CRP-like cAMP-binding protein